MALGIFLVTSFDVNLVYWFSPLMKFFLLNYSIKWSNFVFSWPIKYTIDVDAEILARFVVSSSIAFLFLSLMLSSDDSTFIFLG
jgi:hypothetical protein